MNTKDPSPRKLGEALTRGMLLDAFVFVTNVFLMRLLVGRFVDVVHDAKGGALLSRFSLTAFFTSLLFLAPIGAFLSRWHFHERRGRAPSESGMLSGCLFNPLIYFGVTVVVFSVSAGLILRFVFGIEELSDAGRAVLVIVGLLFVGLHTFVVFRYFSPPSPPTTPFMLSPMSGMIGDICIFTNMLFFQLLWSTLAMGFRRPMNGSDVFTNLLAVSFGALLIYFPPRIFYLAEDIRKTRTWFFIVLANLPVVYLAVFGSSHGLKF
jgi:hypothetical protein